MYKFLKPIILLSLLALTACSFNEKNIICDLHVRANPEKMFECLKDEFPVGADFYKLDKAFRQAKFIRARHNPFAPTGDSPAFVYQRDIKGRARAGDFFWVTLNGSQIVKISASFME